MVTSPTQEDQQPHGDICFCHMPTTVGSRFVLLYHYWVQPIGMTWNATAALVTALTDVSKAFYWALSHPVKHEHQDEQMEL
ncbi:Cubilin [Manis pentadactyla]|nr:Cubilin [Manis pentadactyla]